MAGYCLSPRLRCSLDHSRQLPRLALVGGSTLLSAVCLAVLARAHTVDTGALWQAVQGLQREWLLLAVPIGVGTQIFMGPDRFRRLLAATGHHLPYRTLLAMRLGAGPLRLITPLKAGGLADLAFLQRRHGVPGALSGGCLAYDRLLNLLGLFAWLGLGLSLEPGHRVPLSALVGLALSTLALGACAVHPGIAHAVERLARWLHPRAGRITSQLLAPVSTTRLSTRLGLVLYALVYQSSPWLTGWLLCKAAALPVDLPAAMVGINSAMLAAQLPGPFAGIGPREATLVFTLRALGPSELLMAVGLALSAVISVLPLVVGTPWTGWYLAQVVAPDRRPPIA